MLNSFAITGMIIFFATFLLGLYSIVVGKIRVHYIWSTFTFSVSLWGFGIYKIAISTVQSDAIFWWKVAEVGVILIPVLLFHFIIEFLELKERRAVFLVYFLSLIYIVLNIFTNYYVSGVRYAFNQLYYITANPVFISFIINFLLLSFYSIYILYRKYRNEVDQRKKQQIKYLSLAFFIGFVGGSSSYLPVFGLDILPLGNIAIFVSVLTVFYLLFWHRFLNAKNLLAQIVTFLIWVPLFIRIFLSNTTSERLIDISIFLSTVVLGAFLMRSVLKEVEQKEKIEKLADELKKVNQGQVSLIHFMNHQIKGRFGTAKNIFAELMTDDYGTMPPATIPLLQKGLEEANIGIDYVQNILKGATAESGVLKYDKTPVDFKILVEEVSTKQKEYAENKGLKFSLEIEENSSGQNDYNIVGDHTQLREAVRNLIDNAINYTPEGSISVTLSQKDGKILFKSSDTGVGISEEDKKNLFKAGGRGADALKTNVNATGYGLVFVKNVVEAHGGKVWVESEGKGKGSTFYLEMPK